ncbi:MAG TPA: AMIN domain-containing protein, partial [Terriglobales bacterium]|nr:AMIN domain-containing protein [Terriglobales bacterium]
MTNRREVSIPSFIAGLVVVVMLASVAGIRAEGLSRVTDVSVRSTPDATTVSVETAGTPKYQASLIDPRRLVIDFEDTEYGWRKTPLAGAGPIKEIRGSQFRKGVSRLVVQLARPVKHTVEAGDKGLVIVFASGSAAAEAAPVAAAKPVADAKPGATPKPAADAKPGATPKPAVATATPAAPPAPPAVLVQTPPGSPPDTRAGGGLTPTIAVDPRVAEKPVAAAPAAPTQKPLVASRAAAAPRMMAEAPAAPAPIRIAQAPTPAPAPATPPPASAPGVPNGRRLISLDFKDADVVNLLRILAAESGRNIVVGDDVKGKMSISLRNVPWEQALETVLETRGLQKVERG